MPALRNCRRTSWSWPTTFCPDTEAEGDSSVHPARDALQYDWPGNVRELERMIEGAIATCESQQIGSTTCRSRCAGLWRDPDAVGASDDNARGRAAAMRRSRKSIPPVNVRRAMCSTFPITRSTPTELPAARARRCVDRPGEVRGAAPQPVSGHPPDEMNRCHGDRRGIATAGASGSTSRRRRGRGRGHAPLARALEQAASGAIMAESAFVSGVLIIGCSLRRVRRARRHSARRNARIARSTSAST